MTYIKKGKGFPSFQSVLINVIIHLRTMETEEVFASYQIQDLFGSGILRIFLRLDSRKRNKDLPIYLDVISCDIKQRRLSFNRKFWRILDTIAKIKIMEMELNRNEVYKLESFFSRKISKILEENSLKTLEDVINCNLYHLINFSREDIYQFLSGFEGLYNHLYTLNCLSKAGSSPAKESLIKTSFEYTLVEKISRLKKMESVFEFYSFEITEIFGRDVSRLLKEAGLNTLKDLIYFDNLYNRISLFPQKHRQQFNREFSKIYYCFCFLRETI
jgi:hypothetical protein